jgi:hypothetical protein
MRTLRNEVRWLLGLSLAALIAGCDNDNVFGGNNNNPSNGMNPVSGNTYAYTSAGRLLTFDRANPAATSAVNVTGLQSGETLVGIDIRPGGTTAGQIYGLSSTGRLYVIDKFSGAATLKSTLSADPTDTTAPFTALSGNTFGVDFNPVVDRLRVVSDTGQNLRINVDTGAVTTDGPLNVGGTTRNGVVEAGYTSDFAATCRTTLFYIDATADKLLTTADPNNGVVSEVGALGVDAGMASGFEISTAADGTNTATAALMVGSATNIYTINLTTGAATSNGAIGNLQANETIRGIAVTPATTAPTNALGQMVATTVTNKLVSFTTAAPQKLCTTTAITGLAANENILGIDTRPADGAVYAVTSAGKIYTLNTGTGAVTLKSTLAPAAGDAFTGLTGTEFGVDFNPVPDRLRLVSDMGQNLRVNVDTGAVTTDTALNPAGSTVVAAAYTNAFAGAAFTTLYVLDAAGDRLQIQGAPSGNPNLGDLTTVGALGIGDVQSVAAFDISGTNNQAFAAVNLSGAMASELHTINLTTGASTKVNAIGGGEIIRGATLVGAPVATVFGATADNKLVSFKPATPGTLDTTLAITGLQGGENVLGIDFRQTNGKLYAATSAGKVYTIDPTTAAATLASTFAPDATDTTNPFTMLTGNAFGVDFNPVADRLRIVSDTGASLRINVDTGFVTTDTNLNPGTPQVVAAGYKASFPGTTATQLIDIDLATNSLQLQNPPNDGVLAAIGALDPTLTFTNVAGFDIAGGDDGLPLASLQATGSAQSTLYKVNLKTGAVAPVGAIGPAGTPLVRALAIRVK